MVDEDEANEGNQRLERVLYWGVVDEGVVSYAPLVVGTVVVVTCWTLHRLEIQDEFADLTFTFTFEIFGAELSSTVGIALAGTLVHAQGLPYDVSVPRVGNVFA